LWFSIDLLKESKNRQFFGRKELKPAVLQKFKQLPNTGLDQRVGWVSTQFDTRRLRETAPTPFEVLTWHEERIKKDGCDSSSESKGYMAGYCSSLYSGQKVYYG
jgi:hypothetical protein